MRNSFAVRTERLQLAKTPNARKQAQRRRVMVIGAMLTLALISGAIGMISADRAQSSAQPTAAVEPFSYFPTQ